jgi:hypothetical protein
MHYGGRQTTCPNANVSFCALRHENSSLELAISIAPNRVGVFLRSPEGRNRSSFRNVVFSIYLEIRTIVNVHKSTIVRTLQNLLVIF